VARGGQHRNAGCLSRTHYRLHVVLGEDPLNSHCRWPVAGDPTIDRLLNGQQTASDVEVGRRTDDIDRNQQGLATWDTVDHAETAPGQARVDAQHPHAFPQLLPRDRIAHAIPLALK
jgi:hypothetical protein